MLRFRVEIISFREKLFDLRFGILDLKEGSVFISRNSFENDVGASFDPDHIAGFFEDRQIFGTSHDSPAGGNDLILFFSTIGKHLGFERPEKVLARVFEDLGNGFASSLHDDGIGIDKAEAKALSDSLSNRRLPGAHESDQNQIARPLSCRMH